MLKSYRQLKPTTTVPDSEFGVFLPRAAATTVKAALIGADGAGKTSLLRKLAGVADPLNDEYLPQQSEDPVVNNERFVRVSGYTPAAGRFLRTVRVLKAKHQDLVCVCFGVGDKATFQAVKDQYLPEAAASGGAIVLLGLQSDLREHVDADTTKLVDKQEAKTLAEGLGIPYLEYSVKTGIVDDIVSADTAATPATAATVRKFQDLLENKSDNPEGDAKHKLTDFSQSTDSVLFH